MFYRTLFSLKGGYSLKNEKQNQSHMKMIDELEKSEKITETEEFDHFFKQVLKKMPANSAQIIQKSLGKSKEKSERFIAKNNQKFDQLFDELLVGVDETTRKKSHQTIHFATLAAAIVGFSPIPFSDALLLVPIQLTMMMRLHKLFGASWSEGLAQGITKELVLVGVGRSAAGNVLKFVPAFGSVAGGVINATVAVTITETLGWLTVKMLNDGEDIFKEVLTFEGQFKRLLKKYIRSKNKWMILSVNKK